MSRRTENILLELRGYRQGLFETEAACCTVCGKRVSARRAWWTFDFATLKTGCFCRPCAMFRAFTEKDKK